jgi:three-Cys-motif partner protein
VNLNEEAHSVLQQRVEHYCADGHCLVPHADVKFANRDANEIVHRIMSDIPQHAYVFVLADIENPSQLPFDTVQALKTHGHQSVDLCVLFPEDMALKRMLPYEPSGINPNAAALNRFLGTEAWAEPWRKRKTDAQSPELYREIQRLYENQLRTLTWKHVEEVRDVRRVGAAGLYKILLASKSEVAKKLASWSARKQRRRKSGPGLFD